MDPNLPPSSIKSTFKIFKISLPLLAIAGFKNLFDEAFFLKRFLGALSLSMVGSISFFQSRQSLGVEKKFRFLNFFMQPRMPDLRIWQQDEKHYPNGALSMSDDAAG